MRQCLLVLVSLAVITHHEAAAQPKPASIQGVWQVVQINMTGASPRTISIPEPRPNLTIVTARHYSHIQIEAEGPRTAPSDIAKATADELRAVWGPFGGEAGTYELTGNTITTHPIVAKNPATMAPGAFMTLAFKVQGDTLWLTEQRNQRGPIASPTTFKAVRIE
jgi:hypothetical protein